MADADRGPRLPEQPLLLFVGELEVAGPDHLESRVGQCDAIAKCYSTRAEESGLSHVAGPDHLDGDHPTHLVVVRLNRTREERRCV